MADSTNNRRYELLLPEYYPIKLIGAFIAVDFIVGCAYNCSFCISKRHPSREQLFKEGIILKNPVSPEQMYGWLKTMPSYNAGVQIRIGHDTDAGLQFDSSSKLIEMIDKDHSVTYLTRKPFTREEEAFFSNYRRNILLKLTATPRSNPLETTRNPMNLVRSAENLDPRMLYWTIGPLVEDSKHDAVKIIESLPEGSRVFLKKLNYAGLPHLDAVPPIPDHEYGMLERLALDKGHILTEYFCNSLARVGRGFFDVDKISQQEDQNKADRETGYCNSCTSERLCHEPLDMDDFNRQLDEQLEFLGLHIIEEPKKTGHRSFEIKVNEPSSRGEETYLNHAIKPAVSININTREHGRSQGGSFCNINREVLKRWYNNRFLPVTELNNVAKMVLNDIRHVFHKRGQDQNIFTEDTPLPRIPVLQKCK